jgi:hypothetical protein
MIMHPCCSIYFIVMSGFGLRAKRIQKHLDLDLEKKSQIGKRKVLFSHPSLLPA